jgi:hypothetical protein
VVSTGTWLRDEEANKLFYGDNMGFPAETGG